MSTRCLMVVGSLNRAAPYFQGWRGVGLSVFWFDTATGEATPICEDGGVDNPTFLSLDARSNCIYATSEVFGWHEGTVSAYRFDAEQRRLVYLNKQPSLGSIAAYNGFDRDGRHLLVANYAMRPIGEGPDCACAVFPIRTDGSLGAAVGSVRHEGRGPHPERQERPHPHCIVASPDGRFVVVADLGLDALFTYALALDGGLGAAPVAVAALPPGAGPRHLAFHPDGRHALVVCELDSTVRSFSYDAQTGRFAAAATVSAVPEAKRHRNHCSDIQIHPRGRFVYAGNRGHDSVVVLAFDPVTAALEVRAHVPCGGETPRNLAIDPTGRYLLVANQNSDRVSVFAIDLETGALDPTGCDIAVGSPMCVTCAILPDAPDASDRAAG